MELHRFVWGQSPREICNSVIMKAKLTHFLIFHPCQETYLGQVGVGGLGSQETPPRSGPAHQIMADSECGCSHTHGQRET